MSGNLTHKPANMPAPDAPIGSYTWVCTIYDNHDMLAHVHLHQTEEGVRARIAHLAEQTGCQVHYDADRQTWLLDAEPDWDEPMYEITMKRQEVHQ